MKTKKYFYSKITFLLITLLLMNVACERELSEDAVDATYSTTAEIFIDAPIGLGTDFYFPFIGEASNPIGSKLDAWSIDEDVSYQGSASMRFDVPNSDDPDGNYAGAVFIIDGAGRDLTGYNALTFWAKATQGVHIGEIGFGEDETIVLRSDVSVSTGWSKYIIPIPDPSKLTQEKGMFRYSTASVDGFGYTFWIDELKFEYLDTLSNETPFIQGGEDQDGIAFVGQTLALSDLGVSVTLENGSEVSVNASSNYFSFNSSDSSVASVSSTDVVLEQAGQTVITASLGGVTATGSLNVTSVDLAPIPDLDEANVISIFSDVYTNSTVDYFNGYWAPYQTTLGQDDIEINGNNIIKYTELNFVGIEFQGDNSIDATEMTHFHIDIYLENTLNDGDYLTLKLQDLGTDNVFGGFDPAGEVTLTSTSTPALVNDGWISVDLSLDSFSGLSSRANLAQIVFVSDATVQSIFVDNIYFHN